MRGADRAGADNEGASAGAEVADTVAAVVSDVGAAICVTGAIKEGSEARGEVAGDAPMGCPCCDAAIEEITLASVPVELAPPAASCRKAAAVAASTEGDDPSAVGAARLIERGREPEELASFVGT